MESIEENWSQKEDHINPELTPEDIAAFRLFESGIKKISRENLPEYVEFDSNEPE